MAESSARFQSLDNQQITDLLSDLEAKNTKLATSSAVRLVRNYCAHQIETKKEWFMEISNLDEEEEKQTTFAFENLDTQKLDILMERFFSEVRQQNGENYKLSSYYSLRYGVNRHLTTWRLSNGLPSASLLDANLFPRSNTVFRAMTKKLKKEGKGGVENHPPIENEDMKKIIEYFESNIHNNPTVLQEKVRPPYFLSNK